MDATQQSAPPEASTRSQSRREAESITRAVREAYQRAYAAGITDSDRMARFAYEETADLRNRANTEAAWLFYIKSLARAGAKRGAKPDGQQTEFTYIDGLDELFPIKRAPEVDPASGEILKPARTDQVMLGDFGLAEIRQHDMQIEANIAGAIAERAEWERIKQFVVPLLETHPSWRYRDAIHHLKANGDLADLAPAE